MANAKIETKNNAIKMNFMKVKRNIFRWKQIEKRNGMIFMRIKQRPFIVIKYQNTYGFIKW
ncbi:MAG: hypothetical protein N3D84_03430 [Candidatus Woesearchaeota archaeon]|nr:hypothetical protein [Candidatus Woesearchaeota archaeon]